MIKIVTNLAYLILIGSQRRATVAPIALPTRRHGCWVHSYCISYKSEETEASEVAVHSWDVGSRLA